MKRPARFGGLVAALALAGLTACSSSHMDASGSNVRLNLTDSPIDLTGVTAVNVTVSGVFLYKTDGSVDEGAVALTGGPISAGGGMTINLLDYQNGKSVFVAGGEVPDGSYRRVRLMVDSCELVRDDDGDPTTPDIVEPVDVPSSKVDVPVPFTLTNGQTLELTLDFDAAASVQVNQTATGRYLLRPVVTPAGIKTM